MYNNDMWQWIFNAGNNLVVHNIVVWTAFPITNAITGLVVWFAKGWDDDRKQKKNLDKKERVQIADAIVKLCGEAESCRWEEITVQQDNKLHIIKTQVEMIDDSLSDLLREFQYYWISSVRAIRKFKNSKNEASRDGLDRYNDLQEETEEFRRNFLKAVKKWRDK